MLWRYSEMFLGLSDYCFKLKKVLSGISLERLIFCEKTLAFPRR